MYRLRLLFFLNLVLFTKLSFAQGQNDKWTFGQNNGLDFTSGSPVFFQNSLSSVEGSASVSDASGNLLFYSNGNTVWDSSGAIMPNGGGILGNGPSFQGPGSSTQGVGIAKTIANPDQYYLFTLDANEDINGTIYPGYLRYSIIDMTLNGGLGDVIPTQKNIVLDSFMSEKMAFIKGADCSFWLLTHKHNSASFLSFKVDAAGIAPPVISVSGLAPLENMWGGEMKVSPNGTHVVITGNKTFPSESVIELSEFSITTGQVSNTIELDATAHITRYGYAFSPDNSKLYVSNSLPSFFATYGNVLQFDISLLPNVTSVNASRYQVAYVDKDFGGMRMGPDGKLYIAMPGNSYIASVNDPNISGVACNYDSVALAQPASALFPTLSPFYGHGLGSDALSFSPDTIYHAAKDTVICSGGEAILTFDTGHFYYLWDNGSTSLTRNVSAAGTYWVGHQENSCTYHIDSFKVAHFDPDPVITINEFELGTTLTYNTYQWHLNHVAIPGAVNSTHTITANGDYTVVVTNMEGCSDTSAIYTVTNVTGIDRLPGLDHLITYHPNPAKDFLNVTAPFDVDVVITTIDGRALMHVTKAKKITLKGLAPGLYLMRFYQKDGLLIKAGKLIKD